MNKVNNQLINPLNAKLTAGCLLLLQYRDIDFIQAPPNNWGLG